MADEKFDVIVVGAGPAGTSAAITAAKLGLNVVLLERGEYPGSKNVQGAILYTKNLADIVPDFWKDPQCPLERHITHQNVLITSDDSAINVGFRSHKWVQEPHNCYSIIRVNFDKWYGQKAEAAGVQLYSGVKVSKVLQKEGKVIGIETSEGDQLLSDVVIACDGVNSLLGQSLGLLDEWRSDEVALGVKEVLALPRERIQDRFALEGNEGTTFEIFGKITKGMLGYAFLYTNKESVSFGVGCKLSHFQKSKIAPYDLLESAKNHPMIRRYLADAKPLEYSAHLIPEGGYHSLPTLYTDGFMIAGDAAQMINPTHREGSNLAMTAGSLAAQTAYEAKQKGDFSKITLSAYQQKLEASFIMPDLIDHKDVELKIEKNMDLLTVYPDLACQALYEYFNVDGRSKKEIQKSIFRRILKTRSIANIIKDVMGMVKQTDKKPTFWGLVKKLWELRKAYKLGF
ncbi:MAG: Electron transfer flavoprotein-ubiquinone oxidoreductase [Elusimicrobia bacterium]|nr:Electron transfer flavoprotein-ubiquinone oxidoreductase [Elusimicrobiota bacterium]